MGGTNTGGGRGDKYPWLDITDFGGSPRNTDNAGAVKAALALLAALKPAGGTVFFPRGMYNFATALNLSSLTNVTFRGNGSRYMQDFDGPVSQLNYTGTGTTPAIELSTNNVRNFTLQDIDISYSSSSFTGSLIYVFDTAGIVFDHSSLGGQAYGSGFLSSAAAVVEIEESERVIFQTCLIQQAKLGIWTHTHSGNITSLITIRDTQLDNVTTAHVYVEPGSCDAFICIDSFFDNTSLLNPTYGLELSSTGFSIRGCTFSGSTALASPKTMYVTLFGNGEFCGNNIYSAYPALQLVPAGTYHITGNYLTGNPPMTIVGGNVTGSGNTFVPMQPNGSGGIENATPAVYINSASNGCSLDFGPDTFQAATGGSYTGNSWDVAPTANVQSTVGRIRYNPSWDQSASGPTTSTNLGNFIVFDNIAMTEYTLTTLPTEGGVGGVGTLAQYLTPPGGLDREGKGFEWRAWGTSVVGATIIAEVYFGGTQVYSSGNVVCAAAAWELHGAVFRGSARNVAWASVGGVFNGTVVTPIVMQITAVLTSEQELELLGGASRVRH